MNELVQIVEQITPELGEAEGEPTPLEGGITNRNYLVTLGGKRYVIRVPGKDTNLLGIDRGGERDANQGAAEVGIAPPVAALLTDPPALVTEFVEGTGMEAEDLQEPDALKQIAGELRSYHDSGVSLPTEFDSFSLVREYAETAREPRRRAAPRLRGVAGQRRRDPGEAVGSRARAGPLPQRPAGGQLHPRRPRRSGSSTGSTRAWATATSTSATSRSTTSSTRPARLRCCEVYFGEEPGVAPARDAGAVPLHVGLPRGDVGRRAERRQRHRLRLQRVRRPSTSTAWRKTAADPKFQTWLEEAGGS